MNTRKADVLIIGSGIAGLLAAKLLSVTKNVMLVTKGSLKNSNSILAQGGIAAAMDEHDHWKEHYSDTLTAGNYHNHVETTEILVKNAAKYIQQLIALGVPFDRNSNNELELGREGGHHRNRIVHAGGDATGNRIITQLISHVKKLVTFYENEMTFELLINNRKCVGAITKDSFGNIQFYQAEHIILATGGIGGLYSLSSNDITVTGDGIAMAYRAGASLIDLEFVQFHPTMLISQGKTYGLVSEAVRGEGARLVTNDGAYIMDNIHPLKDLAPRDIVAREIFYSLQNGNQIYLDITMIKDFKKRFPTISDMCEKNGIPIHTGRLPVAPGAHFIMGGIKTTSNGETSIPGLYAIGETAWTGVHGANRLASNSLLEGITFANRVAAHILQQSKQEQPLTVPICMNHKLTLPAKKEIKETMTKHVGIIRDKHGLQTAKKWLEEYLPSYKGNQYLDVSIEDMETVNMLTVGWLITLSALERTESRGGHYRTDYPKPNDEKWMKHYITRRRKWDESNQIKVPSAAIIH